MTDEYWDDYNKAEFERVNKDKLELNRLREVNNVKISNKGFERSGMSSCSVVNNVVECCKCGRSGSRASMKLVGLEYWCISCNFNRELGIRY